MEFLCGDFEQIAKLAEEKGVKHIYMDDTGENTKTMQIFSQWI